MTRCNHAKMQSVFINTTFLIKEICLQGCSQHTNLPFARRTVSCSNEKSMSYALFSSLNLFAKRHAPVYLCSDVVRQQEIASSVTLLDCCWHQNQAQESNRYLGSFFFTWKFKMTCCMRMILLALFVFENRAESGFADL